MWTGLDRTVRSTCTEYAAWNKAALQFLCVSGGCQKGPVMTSPNDSSGRKAFRGSVEPGMIFRQGKAPVRTLLCTIHQAPVPPVPCRRTRAWTENLHQRRPNVICWEPTCQWPRASPVPTTHNPQPTCPLPAAYCLLPTAQCPSQ
jgi:hypothetical protein